MHRRLRRLFLILAISIASVVLPATATHAATTESSEETITWMVRPSDGTGEDGRSWVELELRAGEVAEEHLLIRNLSPAAVTFRLAAADGYFTETGRFNMLTAGEVSTGAGTWIGIQDSVEVASGADVVVPFSVTVPENAEPGDHPAGVAASIRSGGDAEVGVESRVGFRVMTRVAGELAPAVGTKLGANFSGSINPFEPGHVTFTYDVENEGNTRLAVDSVLSLSGPFGWFARDVAVEQIDEIAPGETRTIRQQVSGVWPFVALFLDRRTQAEVVGNSSAEVATTTTDASSVVWAIPWSQLGVLVIVAIILLLARWDRRRKAKHIERLIDRARNDARAESAGVRAVSSIAPTLLVIGLLLTGLPGTVAPAYAADDQDHRQVLVEVEVTPPPTTVPTAPPSTIPPEPDDLATTGAGDFTPILALAGLAFLLGSGILVGNRALASRRERAGVTARR
ncbi:COG1470 family protein [Agromyces silvae]|uniref:COG1470 family protein n=1 Tax=Agromyces silvae TaxID=3388266 RepID=UPI00280BE920|nr:hypothetical protein [Agromyces protaetiae]